MPVSTIHVDAILFDMDGTLIDSTAGVNGAWEMFAKDYPGVDMDKVLSSAHGFRTVDNLRIHCGLTDPEVIEKEAERFETAIVTVASQPGSEGIVKLPGVKEIMEELEPARHLPNPVWAVCTSATRKYSSQAIVAAGIAPPDVFIRSEDVERGKPNPDPYLEGAHRCGVKPENCIVVEDAPPGVRSGVAAGCKTIGLLTTHSREAVLAEKPTFLVKDLSCVTVKRSPGGGVDLTIDHE
ncbi:HAD-like domain-containing protein [Schizophyllum amplum]|uniref:HAD-like domain-containing protein n=1 Tax=Schizophyllum amplum TaxID=97359 RepID=A0A550CTK6_9AGAR|nr:HAD-like domain-containing protein [Auriculariopsis ampla]